MVLWYCSWILETPDLSLGNASANYDNQEEKTGNDLTVDVTEIYDIPQVNILHLKETLWMC